MNNRKRILIVDDEQQNVDLLEAVLTTLGYECSIALNGYEALSKLNHSIDLVLLDVMMRGIDGFEVARRIRNDRDCSEVPIIMVTALEGKRDRLKAVEAGVNDFITKPIDRVELRVRMESLLRMKEARDAVKRYQAELEATVEARTAALKESEARMRLLIESSPIGIMIVQNTKCSYVNPALIRMFGYDQAGEIVGKPVETLCAIGDRSLFTTRVSQVLAGQGEVHALEIAGLKGNGQVLELAVWLTATEFAGAPALLGFLIDISEQKALRSQLLHAQKMEALGTLAGGIAHDFNNILFAVMGYTELALDALPEGSVPSDDLQRVMEAAERARYMVQQILTFSRETEQEKRPTYVTPIMKEAVKFLRATIPTTIEITESIRGDIGTILADPTRIHQVLMNLCTNSAHAMRETGGVLDIRMDGVVLGSDRPIDLADLTPGEYLRLAVRDTGHGMPPEVMQRMFEPYFSTKKPGEGTGLGLSVVHGIVKTYDGGITVESRPGIGTTFQIFFPLIEGETDYVHEMGQSTPRGSERLLVVDDEPELAVMCQRTLDDLGYRTTAVTNSLEALDMFRLDPNEFDLILTDMTMPHMTGLELASQTKKIRAGIPVVLLTGYSDLITGEEIRTAGLHALLHKPVTKAALAGIIRNALDGITKSPADATDAES
ncbi:MAG: response regulator [Pseudomonadota bacterium]